MAFQQRVVPESIPTPKPSKAEKRLARELELFDSQPDGALITTKLVCVLRGRSPSSNQRDVKAGRLAPPIRIGPNAIRFRVGDVRLSLKGTKTDTSLHDISPEPIGQLGHNGGLHPVIAGGRKKRGGQNG